MMDWNLILWVCCVLAAIGFLYYFAAKLLSHRKEVLEMKLLHEKEMKEKEWERKMQWEKMLSGKSDKVAELEGELKKKEDTINSLKAQLKKTTQLDIERVALLLQSFSGNEEPLTSEKTAKMMEHLKSTQKAIKEYLEKEL